MERKNIEELEADLQILKEREKQVKEEMELLRKTTDVKQMRKRKGKMFALAEVVIDCLGEDVLDQQDVFRQFIYEYEKEWKEMGYRGEAS